MTQVTDPLVLLTQVGPRGDDDERGQAMVEYAFILVLVAMVVIVLVTVLGHTTSNLYSNVSSGLNS